MNINSIQLIPYNLEFKQSLFTSSEIYDKRDGIIIIIEADGMVGFGETSPLPGFSNELLFECRNQIEGLIFAIKDDNSDINLEDLLELSKVHTIDCPAAQFGLETALYDLASKIEKKSLAEFLSKDYLNKINISGLADIHSLNNEFLSIKVKVRSRNLFDKIQNIENITNKFGEHTKLRLDCNQSLNLVQAIRFCKEMENFNIEYIEQPLPKNQLDDMCELRFHTDIPIAADESITNLKSAEQIIDKQAADVFIIKPTMIGSYKQIESIINLARAEGIKPIITSLFENIVGVSACAHLASANKIHDACGLATLDLFNNNFQEISIKKGQMEIAQKNGLGVSINKINLVK